MAEENADPPKPEQEKDEKGRFLPKTKTEDNGRSLPKTSDYSKMNRILQKQTGITAEKFLSLQDEYEPKELFERLSFVNDIGDAKTTDKPKLPPNKPIGLTPAGSDERNDDIKIPGFTSTGKPQKGQYRGSLDLIKSIKNKKK